MKKIINKKIKRVLLIANNGQLGFILNKKLLKLNEEYEIFSYSRDGLDISSQSAISTRCDEIKPNFIVNCAAFTNVDRAEIDVKESFAINETGPKKLAYEALKHNALLIHISTDYVFDGRKNSPYDETDNTNPLNSYGKSKLFGEFAIERSGCKHIILRTSWVFGEHGKNFAKTMLKLGNEKKHLNIIDDQFGGPTYAGDLADAILKIIANYKDSTLSGLYHYSGYPNVSWYSFAKKIFESAEQNIEKYTYPKICKTKSSDYPMIAIRPKNTTLNCCKIKNNFGIKQSNWQKEILNISKYLD